jgi:hypothetical protein
VSVLKELPTMSLENHSTARVSTLGVEAMSSELVPSLKVFNATTGASLGNILTVGNGKYVGQLLATGS